MTDKTGLIIQQSRVCVGIRKRTSTMSVTHNVWGTLHLFRG